METQVENVLAEVSEVIIGKQQQVKLALTCILAKGHLLIEDLPGMGKTTLAHTLAAKLGLAYQRTQFTNDMLPADIIGVSIFDQKTAAFTLHQGPLFNQVVLADEINRASPKTQSALLEAMETGQVSIDGKTYPLPIPFFVIATQNPQHYIGTYPLPESQLDRFMMKISLGFPDLVAERKILAEQGGGVLDRHLEAQLTDQQLLVMQQQVQQVHLSDAVVDYVIALCRVSRQQQPTPEHVKLNFDEVAPLSPRAAKALISAAKAWAFIHQRDHVLPDDIQAVFAPVCEHRLARFSDFSPAHYHNSATNELTSDSVLQPLSGEQYAISTKIIASVDVLNPIVE